MKRHCALSALLLASILIAPLSASPAGASGCNDPPTMGEVLVASPAHKIGTTTEYAYFAVLRDTPLESQRSSTNGLDALVHELQCSGAGTYTIDIAPGMNDDVDVLVRGYDAFETETFETPCQGEHTGSFGAETDYLVAVPCNGLPQNFISFPDPPFTVWIKIDLN